MSNPFVAQTNLWRRLMDWLRKDEGFVGQPNEGPTQLLNVGLWGPGPNLSRPTRAIIGNFRDGGVFFWIVRLYFFLFLTLLVLAGGAVLGIYSFFAVNAPSLPNLGEYANRAPAVSRMLAHDGTLLGEFASERREIVAFEEIPPMLVKAFLAAEDHEFFEHHGIYFKGIFRALSRNISSGDFAQGGSTITQQVAKQFLGNQKTIGRKVNEAIIARRLERAYSKQAILSVYMNQIAFGHKAFGVKAAAKRFFANDLADLDIAEMATIAGLAQAPTRFSPINNPEQCKERRNQVLEKMERYGVLSKEQTSAEMAKPLHVAPYEDMFGDRSPYYAEDIRLDIGKRLGKDALDTQGLTVETAVDPVADTLAHDTIDFGVRKQDKRQGYRGPVAHLDDAAQKTFRTRAQSLYGDEPLLAGRRYLALVESVESSMVTVSVGGNRFSLPLQNARWAAPWSKTDATNDHTIDSLKRVLDVGDVIWVGISLPAKSKFQDWRLDGGVNPHWIEPLSPEQWAKQVEERKGTVQLEQTPHPQGALFVADHQTGYVVAMIGGTDFARSRYNRVTNPGACRQPGSTYKPIYYSAALDIGYGFDSALNDIAKEEAEVDPVTGQVWTPQNLYGTQDTVVNMEYAMVFSKNVPSVSLFTKVGAKNVEAWARRLGFSTTIIADRALALGASCTYLHELTRAFAIFARNGEMIDWVWIRRVLARNGEVLLDNRVYVDEMVSPNDRLNLFATQALKPPKQAIPARTAFLTSKLLATTIEHGFSSIIRNPGLHVAGKTGTSSDTMDTTFVAYTSRWIATAWMGDDDRERPLGLQDAAYMVVEPLWARFMVAAAEGHANLEIPWKIPKGVNKNDRGDHSKGTKHFMDLVWRKAGGGPPVEDIPKLIP